ncbi:MAG: methylated-DNA--[protein]-cysteine S-methyltransferase [Bacteroidota bacterium]
MEQLITLNTLKTPLGQMIVGVYDEKLCLLEFADRSSLEDQISGLKRFLQAETITGRHPAIESISNELIQYFEGTRHSYDIPILLAGTPFQKRVWQALQNIPYGSTRSYKQQAAAIGELKAIRAVANANAQNRISIIIPCHRVIGSDGSITGYSGGLHRKQWLLKHEFENHR